MLKRITEGLEQQQTLIVMPPYWYGFSMGTPMMPMSTNPLFSLPMLITCEVSFWDRSQCRWPLHRKIVKLGEQAAINNAGCMHPACYF
jgi:hypothetical protein